jgi:hypothetical protein
MRKLFIPLLVMLGGCASGPEFTRPAGKLSHNPFITIVEKDICQTAECANAGALCTINAVNASGDRFERAKYICKFGLTCARGGEDIPTNPEWGRCIPTHQIEELADYPGARNGN